MSKHDLTYGPMNEVCLALPYAMALELQGCLLTGERPSKAVIDWFAAVPVYETEPGGEPIRFRNYYKCEDCGWAWTDEWAATCDDDCPHCGTTMTPFMSDDIEPG
jgi:hypothetical protein